MSDNDQERGDPMSDDLESLDESAEQSRAEGVQIDESQTEDSQSEEQLQSELQDAVKSGRAALWVNFSLNIAGFILAVWVLLGMLGILPAADILLYVWVGVMALVFALQLHPDIKRVKRIRKDLDS